MATQQALLSMVHRQPLQALESPLARWLVILLLLWPLLFPQWQQDLEQALRHRIELQVLEHPQRSLPLEVKQALMPQ